METGMNAFICPICKNPLDSFKCPSCGHAVPEQSGVYRFTDDPDLVTGGDGDKYIGYEHIGESFLCRESLILSAGEYRLPKMISDIVGGGILLDLGCGDGALSVPCASFGTKIIAGDISCKMLELLVRLADSNGISLENVTLARMNALHIPLQNNSVDAVIANSMLHVISAPEKVVAEIHRVLRPGGSFLCFCDAPGGSSPDGPGKYDNAGIGAIFNCFYSKYWKYLRSHGINQVHYSWKFDRDACCMNLFSKREEREYEYEAPYTETSLHDYSFPRTKGRGWSDQVNVPGGLHCTAYDLALRKTYRRYGKEVDRARYREGGETRKQTIIIYSK